MAEKKLIEFTQGYQGYPEAHMYLTDVNDKERLKGRLPKCVIPVVFIPGIMGSNLRMRTDRQQEKRLNLPDNRAWRPDDFNKISALLGTGYAGRFKKAEPWQRQMMLDPVTTEVDEYQSSLDSEHFDRSGDVRQNNVDGKEIPPLLLNDPGSHDNPYDKKTDKDVMTTAQSPKTAAQKKRWRGWGEVMYESYGELLEYLESTLNQPTKDDGTERGWQRLYGIDPGTFATNPVACQMALTSDECKPLTNAWFPVHAMGYNWLKSNGDSAVVVAARIEELIKHYDEKIGVPCKEVIVVTHSMGGLVARALVHPKHGKLQDKVLGVYHGVMPTLGAAATYKRMRGGFEGSGLAGSIAKKILGPTAASVTAVLANAQGGLELLPADAYGPEWLHVQDSSGTTLKSWPVASPLEDIYVNPDPNAWWRLVNPEQINPASLDSSSEELTIKKLVSAQKFTSDISKTLPNNCYASYGDDKNYPAFGEVVWKVEGTPASTDPSTWRLLHDDGQGLLTMECQGKTFVVRMQPPADSGDGTVPARRSASMVMASRSWAQSGYDHQSSYSKKNHAVFDSVLYSVVKIAQKAKVLQS